MIFLKRFVLNLFVVNISLFLLFGLSFIYYFFFTIFYVFFIIILEFIVSAKLRYIKYDGISISYKKRKILFSEINSVVFTKLILSGNISINKPFKKNSLMLSILPKNKFLELKDVILDKLSFSKVKNRNRIFFQLFYPIIFVLFFIVSFIVNTNIPQYDFDKRVHFQSNIETDHFSFKIDGIIYDTMLSDSLFYLLTDNGKIFYEEFKDEGISLRKTFDFPKYIDVIDLSLIDYLFSNDFGILKKLLRFSIIKDFKPILFESKEFKGVLLTVDSNSKTLNLKKKGKKVLLRIYFSNQFTAEKILEILESVSYH